jgi:hypothetical protein
VLVGLWLVGLWLVGLGLFGLGLFGLGLLGLGLLGPRGTWPGTRDSERQVERAGFGARRLAALHQERENLVMRRAFDDFVAGLLCKCGEIAL